MTELMIKCNSQSELISLLDRYLIAKLDSKFKSDLERQFIHHLMAAYHVEDGRYFGR